MDKRGGTGNFIVMFVATIAIVIILLIFVLGSGLVKKFHKVDAGVSIHDETRTGLNDVLNYVLNYEKFVKAKLKVVLV